MADPLEARICNWILELLAHTFGCLCALPAAGAVPAGALESFSDGADNLLIGIEIDFHVIISYGVSIAAVADNLIENVKYKVSEFTGLEIKKINIYVEGVRVID